MEIPAQFIDKSRHIQAGADTADWARKDVIEEKGGDRQFCCGAPHRFSHYFVHAAANEHAAAFDIDGSDRV